MKVTVYTTEDCGECRRVCEMLAVLAAREGFELREAGSPEGAPAPCVRFEAPGSPFFRAEGLTEEQFLAYLDAARKPVAAPHDAAVSHKKRTARKAGSPPTPEFEARHPVRSYLWRHRVGALVATLSAFTGIAWAAPLTVSLGWGTGFYHAVHSVYRLVCDQVPERSAQFGGLPVCLCWRCTAIYVGSLLFGVVYTLGRDRKIDWLKWLRRPASLPVMLLYGLPLILDGASHAFGLRPGISYANSSDFWLSWGAFSADWWLRIATSLLATTGAVRFLCPRLDKLGSVYEQLHAARAGRDVPGALPRRAGA